MIQEISKDGPDQIPHICNDDDLVDITNSIPFSPNVNIDYEVSENRRLIGSRNRSITIIFNSIIEDNDSENFTYHWYFGDGESSIEENPTHTFIIADDHVYNVILQ